MKKEIKEFVFLLIFKFEFSILEFMGLFVKSILSKLKRTKYIFCIFSSKILKYSVALDCFCPNNEI